MGSRLGAERRSNLHAAHDTVIHDCAHKPSGYRALTAASECCITLRCGSSDEAIELDSTQSEEISGRALSLSLTVKAQINEFRKTTSAAYVRAIRPTTSVREF